MADEVGTDTALHMRPPSAHPGWARIGRLVATLVLIATPVISQSAGASAVLSNPVEVTADAGAPGMLKVAWNPPSLQPDERVRLQWWSTASTIGVDPPLGSVVLDGWRDDSTSPALVIPNLAPGSYSVHVDVVNATSLVSVVGDASGTVAAYTALPPCPDTLVVCGGISAPEGAYVRGGLITGGTGGDLLGGMNGGFSWKPPDIYWPVDNSTGARDWVRVKLQFVDRAGLSGALWWSAFGDRGSNRANATGLLVPLGGSVNLGTVTMAAQFGPVTGDFTKLDADGTTEVPLTTADFGHLCVEVYEEVSAGPPAVFEYATSVCGWENFGFGDPDYVGRWHVGLMPGTYRLKFLDSPNYYGADNVLLYNVHFAAQWWKSDGTRGERLSDASDFVVVNGQARTGIAGVMRPSKQLRLDVVNIPAEVDVNTLRGDIRVNDDFGNWTGGAMVVDKANRTVGANVTGLVENRPYRIFLSFSDGNGMHRWWLVGGGTLEDAVPEVPAGTIVEDWQPRPLAVTMHDASGAPLAAGVGCLVLTPLDSTTPTASACTDNYGVVLLQRAPLGTYRVMAYQRNPVTLELVGAPVQLDNFEVTNALPQNTVFTDYAYGLHDVSRLGPGAALPYPYVDVSAVVIPALRPMVVTIHGPSGTPFGIAGACVSLTPVGGGTATTSCVTGDPYPGIVRIPALPFGTYAVTAYKQDPRTGRHIGGITLANFDITPYLAAAQDPNFRGYAVGLHDISRLTGTLSPYPEVSAIVIDQEPN